MVRLKLKLTTTIEVTATAEVEVECDDLNDAAARLEKILDELDKKDADAYVAHQRDPLNVPYPTKSINWSVDQDDVEEQVNNKLVDIEGYEEVET